ncbi:MAG: hypothetical protein KatS3mg131_0832 [Candidatus Tectimicrobiota bacterium]|nr:MAG: hypothetical protein KatS3mg131_0832 [Candidatus Tectomicrobia bacterium]
MRRFWLPWLFVLLLWSAFFSHNRGMARAAADSSTAQRDAAVGLAGVVVPTVAPLATIFHAPSGHLSLADGDEIVLDAGEGAGLLVGIPLRVVRVAGVVRHPTQGHILGTLVLFLGEARVTQVQATTATAVITKAFDAVVLGDQVLPPSPILPPQPARHREPTGLSGVVIAAPDGKTALAQGDVVYVNRGAEHGLRRGDRLRVLAHDTWLRHPRTRRPVRLPAPAVGELVLVDVRPHTATALVTASVQEFAVGARVVYVPSEAVTEAGTTERPPPPSSDMPLPPPPPAETRVAKEAVAEHYTVQRGDTLWGIAALPAIYREPLLWPLIYRANQTQIVDPDLIYPRQRLRIPARLHARRSPYCHAARAHAGAPGAWGDGPDRYILEGVRP